uniref:MATH domain-containing protein n=1 Tax=Panagrolaimus sp. ES5 TaxID=591445 RepID=A0AC34FHF0_9BILA
MSLFLQERIKEQESDDRTSDKNIVFTFPWIFNFPFQDPNEENDEDAAAEISFTTSYKMGTTHWKICFSNEYHAIYVSNSMAEEWNGRCYISYTLYYDAEMRFEFFSSTRVKMEEEYGGYRKNLCTPDGYMTRFIDGMNKKKFSKCVIFVEMHLPLKYFLQPSFKRELYEQKSEISDILPDDYENDFRFEFLKNG